MERFELAFDYQYWSCHFSRIQCRIGTSDMAAVRAVASKCAPASLLFNNRRRRVIFIATKKSCQRRCSFFLMFFFPIPFPAVVFFKKTLTASVQRVFSLRGLSGNNPERLSSCLGERISTCESCQLERQKPKSTSTIDYTSMTDGI